MNLKTGDKIKLPDGSMVLQIVGVRLDGYDFQIVAPLETLSSNDAGDPMFVEGGWVPA